MKRGHLYLTLEERDTLLKTGFVKIDDEERGEISVSMRRDIFDKVLGKEDDEIEGRKISVRVYRSGSAATQDVDDEIEGGEYEGDVKE